MTDEYIIAVDATVLVKVIDGEVTEASLVVGEDMPDASRRNGDDIDADGWSGTEYMRAAKAACHYINDHDSLVATRELT